MTREHIAQLAGVMRAIRAGILFALVLGGIGGAFLSAWWHWVLFVLIAALIAPHLAFATARNMGDELKKAEPAQVVKGDRFH